MSLACGGHRDLDVTDALKEVAPVRAVFGNIDGQAIRAEWPEHTGSPPAGPRFG